ncbi:hypothetical protein ElyMa_002690900 [Elysia marginata]|uniref:Reverse transcriptase domain-containing protein n=1 Tax=Elysia marginata TaxID=1093978 RepID=A0AAV4HD12_9GAST|nr:hypothetical protein ElyMa_002690900 [Elysia marginata]
MIMSFHGGMMGAVKNEGSSQDPFPFKGGVKQGCILTPALFCISDSAPALRLPQFRRRYLPLHEKRSPPVQPIPSHDKVKTKVHRVLIREMLFADNAALDTNS